MEIIRLKNLIPEFLTKPEWLEFFNALLETKSITMQGMLRAINHSTLVRINPTQGIGSWATPNQEQSVIASGYASTVASDSIGGGYSNVEFANQLSGGSSNTLFMTNVGTFDIGLSLDKVKFVVVEGSITISNTEYTVGEEFKYDGETITIDGPVVLYAIEHTTSVTDEESTQLIPATTFYSLYKTVSLFNRRISFVSEPRTVIYKVDASIISDNQIEVKGNKVANFGESSIVDIFEFRKNGQLLQVEVLGHVGSIIYTKQSTSDIQNLIAAEDIVQQRQLTIIDGAPVDYAFTRGDDPNLTTYNAAADYQFACAIPENLTSLEIELDDWLDGLSSDNKATFKCLVIDNANWLTNSNIDVTVLQCIPLSDFVSRKYTFTNLPKGGAILVNSGQNSDVKLNYTTAPTFEIKRTYSEIHPSLSNRRGVVVTSYMSNLAGNNYPSIELYQEVGVNYQKHVVDNLTRVYQLGYNTGFPGVLVYVIGESLTSYSANDEDWVNYSVRKNGSIYRYFNDGYEDCVAITTQTGAIYVGNSNLHGGLRSFKICLGIPGIFPKVGFVSSSNHPKITVIGQTSELIMKRAVAGYYVYDFGTTVTYPTQGISSILAIYRGDVNVNNKRVNQVRHSGSGSGQPVGDDAEMWQSAQLYKVTDGVAVIPVLNNTTRLSTISGNIEKVYAIPPHNVSNALTRYLIDACSYEREIKVI